jgi:hypothetical protein
MVKASALSGLLILMIAFFLSACASTGDEGTSSGSSTESTQSTETVPGEKLSDERFAPGPTGTSGAVRW